ncbi:MAG: DNA helicase RecQ [Pirellula sp.]
MRNPGTPSLQQDATPKSSVDIPPDFFEMLHRTWGFDRLRDSQQRPMASILRGQDTLVVMPTGGGKSLCYQAPAIYRGGLTIVVSPLLALMKDQVDGLNQLGLEAARLDSTLTGGDKRALAEQLKAKRIRLLYVSPERALAPDFASWVQGNEVHTIAIDEAHCVSQWGHDFRVEYRQLARMRELFPKAAVVALTATATQRVRKDIIDQLGLRQPIVAVSSFDRPNLTYRVQPQRDIVAQIREVIDRHRGSGGIVYCLRRSDVEALTQALRDAGCSVGGYHAGMSDADRHAAQEAFLREQVDVVIATVAFGMGIDRSNVRFVVHACVPKSIEHYQQETGRAGRDGLAAECLLLYSKRDAIMLKRMVQRGLEESSAAPAVIDSQMQHIDDMIAFCEHPGCRHRRLVEYFDESYVASNCNACDMCLGEADCMPDGKVLAQKILSCIHHMNERFGAHAVCQVLVGAKDDTIVKRGHDKLSTYGILKEHGASQVRQWIHQLIDQRAIAVEGAEYPVLKLNARSREILFGNTVPSLLRAPSKTASNGGRKGSNHRRSASSSANAEVPAELFEQLRALRKQLADAANIAPYLLFSDTVLTDLCIHRPSTRESMLQIDGIGEAKSQAYGDPFLETIRAWSSQSGQRMDVALRASGGTAGSSSFRATTLPSKAQQAVRPLLMQSLPLETIAQKVEVTVETVCKHLVGLLEAGDISSIDPWVSPETQADVQRAANACGRDRLKPIYDALNQTVPYHVLRLVLMMEAVHSIPVRS